MHGARDCLGPPRSTCAARASRSSGWPGQSRCGEPTCMARSARSLNEHSAEKGHVSERAGGTYRAPSQRTVATVSVRFSFRSGAGCVGEVTCASGYGICTAASTEHATAASAPRPVAPPMSIVAVSVCVTTWPAPSRQSKRSAWPGRSCSAAVRPNPVPRWPQRLGRGQRHRAGERRSRHPRPVAPRRR